MYNFKISSNVRGCPYQRYLMWGVNECRVKKSALHAFIHSVHVCIYSSMPLVRFEFKTLFEVNNSETVYFKKV